jgi:hypothetical protein
MDSVPISHAFNVFVKPGQFQEWDTDIQNLLTDEKQNPKNATFDEKAIEHLKELEENLREMITLAAQYRKTDNDATLSKELQILNGRQETLSQLVSLDQYIKGLEADTKKNPQNAKANAEKIANAIQEEKCIEQFQKAWEAYQQSGDSADKNKLNFFIKELQNLRTENPTGPLSQNLIWEDFQEVLGKYTTLEFLGQKYAVE